MSIKLILLKSGETLITDAKEFVTENPITNEKEVQGYLFNKPNVLVVYSKDDDQTLLTEENDKKIKSEGEELQVMFSPWILLTNDEDITVPKDWIVTIVEPISLIKKMYEEKVNEQSS